MDLDDIPLICSWDCIECGRVHYDPLWAVRFECDECGEYNWSMKSTIVMYDDDYGM